MSQPDHVSYQKAMRAALRLLRYRDRTAVEIREKLAQKGFGEPETELALVTLQNSGYVDDSRVADRAAEIALTDRPSGRLRLEHELRSRGTSEDEIERVIAEFDGPDEADRAETLLRRRMKPEDTPQKSASFLARKGFDEDAVQTVIERVYDRFE